MLAARAKNSRIGPAPDPPFARWSNVTKQFHDRRAAGRELARLLEKYRGHSDVLVLALPRGGVPVAYEVAVALGVPLDVFVVRKLGVPDREELAMGAIATGGVLVMNEELVWQLGITPEAVETVVAREAQELMRREADYRGRHGRPRLRGRTVILVDDGLATGSTMRAAIEALARLGAAHTIVAVPVAARSTCVDLRAEVDDLVCGRTPEPFFAVGAWYEDFAQTSDEEVRALLESAREAGQAGHP
jgi:predicted phosphoribosyltransferase